MRVPLEDYLTRKPQELKVFRLTAEICLTPIEIDIHALINRYGFDPSYDRFRFWVKLTRFESRHVVKPKPLSPLIPLHLIIRRLDIDSGWLMCTRLWAEGFIEVLCNDEGVARKFYEDVLASHRHPEDGSPVSELHCGWTGEAVEFYLGLMTGALSNYFGTVKADSPKLKELRLMCKRFIKGISKEKPKADMYI